MDDRISSIDGVLFFFSCITGVVENARRARHENVTSEDDSSPVVYPGVAHFVAYRPTRHCTQDIIFKAMHEADVEPTISTIRTRNARGTDGVLEKASRQLCSALKDHDNQAIIEMVKSSNLYCQTHSLHLSDEEEGEGSPQSDCQRSYPKIPCRLVVVDETEYIVQLCEAHERLVSDGLKCEIAFLGKHATVSPSSLTSPSELTVTIKDLDTLMAACHHCLHRGDVYAKPDGATMTFVRMTDVKSYLNKLLANDALRERLLKHFSRLVQILSHSACEIIHQIQFDADLIEVNDGVFFRISKRAFCDSPPLGEDKYRKISPRAYVPFDSRHPPDAGYFMQAVTNSFPHVGTRVAFLNKFYQCLSGQRMPQKVRKLVVAGPRDSGKTSWASIFHRIVPRQRIASVTNEKQFSASMIDSDTELVIIDDWSSATMDSDLAKTILQGGWFVTSVKHQTARCAVNKSPFYITTNQVPNFGEESGNVARRIAIFQTKSLPRTVAGVDKWIFDHAMECVLWMAEQINANIDLVDAQERWYENIAETGVIGTGNEAESDLFNLDVVSRVAMSDLRDASALPATFYSPSMSSVHDAFTNEAHRRKLKRRREQQANRGRVSSSDDEDDAIVHTNNGPPFLCQTTNHSDSELEPAGSLIGLVEQDLAPADVATRQDADVTPSAHETTDKQDSDEEWVATPPTWTMNSTVYFQKVHELIRYGFYPKKLNATHTLSFLSRMRNAPRREKLFWTKADPNIDAWMLIIGKTRDVFDIKQFVTRFPNVDNYLARIRKVVKCHVLEPYCPAKIAKQQLKDGNNTNERNNVGAIRKNPSKIVVKRKRVSRRR